MLGILIAIALGGLALAVVGAKAVAAGVGAGLGAAAGQLGAGGTYDGVPLPGLVDEAAWGQLSSAIVTTVQAAGAGGSTSQTVRVALAAYQSSTGLPVTGSWDVATQSKAAQVLGVVPSTLPTTWLS